MKIQIARHDFTIIWDGIYYFALSDYPNISSWELKKIISFIEYERQYGSKTEIEFDDRVIMEKVHHVIHNSASLVIETVRAAVRNAPSPPEGLSCIVIMEVNLLN